MLADGAAAVSALVRMIIASRNAEWNQAAAEGTPDETDEQAGEPSKDPSCFDNYSGTDLGADRTLDLNRLKGPSIHTERNLSVSGDYHIRGDRWVNHTWLHLLHDHRLLLLRLIHHLLLLLVLHLLLKHDLVLLGRQLILLLWLVVSRLRLTFGDLFLTYLFVHFIDYKSLKIIISF